MNKNDNCIPFQLIYEESFKQLLKSIMLHANKKV
jgi:hypothetical protein